MPKLKELTNKQKKWAADILNKQFHPDPTPAADTSGITDYLASLQNQYAQFAADQAAASGAAGRANAAAQLARDNTAYDQSLEQIHLLDQLQKIYGQQSVLTGQGYQQRYDQGTRKAGSSATTRGAYSTQGFRQQLMDLLSGFNTQKQGLALRDQAQGAKYNTSRQRQMDTFTKAAAATGRPTTI